MHARLSRRSGPLYFSGSEPESTLPQGKPSGLPHLPTGSLPPHPDRTLKPRPARPPAYTTHLHTRRSSARRRTRHYRCCDAGRGPALGTRS
ncbi:hypothetical protein NDU88_006820 [Pleurodeles waltl]|uniref:Uncharacterized protein n=1 Tax=Pleurodeles waltl TaxID=8319 RepID=A0AAV7LRS7_PLEWA|nr:hypothetical protein NDU88_006820 [Pleurodeles waltl]